MSKYNIGIPEIERECLRHAFTSFSTPPTGLKYPNRAMLVLMAGDFRWIANHRFVNINKALILADFRSRAGKSSLD